jgi:hypothetical protein
MFPPKMERLREDGTFQNPLYLTLQAGPATILQTPGLVVQDLACRHKLPIPSWCSQPALPPSTAGGMVGPARLADIREGERWLQADRTTSGSKRVVEHSADICGVCAPGARGRDQRRRH